MNHYQLLIHVDDKQVVLERILQVTRYRGFLINGIEAKVNTGTHIGTIKLQVSSERPIELLVDQINKLIDIKDVSVDNNALAPTAHKNVILTNNKHPEIYPA